MVVDDVQWADNPSLRALTFTLRRLVGFRTQWSSNVVFGSGGLSDEVALFLWGVAAFVTGKTVSDLLSKVVSS